MVCLNDPGSVTGYSAKFSPDSRRIALAHLDGELLVYDLATHRASRCRRGPGPARDLAYRSDGAQIAVIYPEKPPSCQIIEADSGKLLRSIVLPALGESVAWSPDGAMLATPCEDRKIYLWDAATGIRRSTLEGSTRLGLRAAFHPAGTLLASNGWEGQLRLWDPVLGRPVLSVTSNLWPEFQNEGQIVIAFEDNLTGYEVDPATRIPDIRACFQRADRLSIRGAFIVMAGFWPWARIGEWRFGTWRSPGSSPSYPSGMPRKWCSRPPATW